MKQIFLLAISTIVGVMMCCAQGVPAIHSDVVEQSREYIEGNDYQKDLLLYVDMLKNTHPRYADAESCTALDRKAKMLYRAFGRLTSDVEFKLRLAELAASHNDGHTAIFYWSVLDRIYPVRMTLDDDASAVIDICSEEHRELLGKRVVSINGEKLNHILKSARRIVSADNDVNFENLVEDYMMLVEFWQFIGLDEERLLLSFDDGTSAEIAAIDKSELKIVQRQSDSASRVTKNHGVLFDYVIFEEEGICYLQFNQFVDRLTYPAYQQLARFDDFVSDMMTEIKIKNVETLVVDLQYNGGGNSVLGDVLLSWLYPHRDTKKYNVDVRVSELLLSTYPQYREFTFEGSPVVVGSLYDMYGFDHIKDYEIDYDAPQDSSRHVLNFDEERIFNGNVIFIQGKASFSSTTLLLTVARDNNIGIIVGELSGGKPNHYGDVLYCMLPNTATIATVSHKKFTRPNSALPDTEYLYPDVMIQLDDPNCDRVWEWIVANYAKNSVANEADKQKADSQDAYLWDTIYSPSMNN